MMPKDDIRMPRVGVPCLRDKGAVICAVGRVGSMDASWTGALQGMPDAADAVDDAGQARSICPHLDRRASALGRKPLSAMPCS